MSAGAGVMLRDRLRAGAQVSESRQMLEDVRRQRTAAREQAVPLPHLTTPLAEAAVAYARRGWPVLPLRGKVPVGGHGLLDATSDVVAVRELWRRWPRANVGIRIPQGLVVVDLDGEAGVASWRALGAFPATLTAKTARGWHLWWEAPHAVELRQLAGVLPGVDTRTEGRGYVVAPPSVHPDTGVVYEWARRRPAAPLPQAVIELLRARPPAAPVYVPPQVGPLSRSFYAEAALRGEAAAVAATPQGGRNHRLYAAWLRCTRDEDVAPYLLRELVRRELTRAAQAAGLTDHEIARTLRETVAA